MSAHIVSAPSAEDSSRPLLIRTDRQAGHVTVAGELDRASGHHLEDDVLEAVTRTDQHTWTVDAAGITSCDAEGLRVLARAQALAERRTRVLVLVRPRPFLVTLLGLVGMHQPAAQARCGTA